MVVVIVTGVRRSGARHWPASSPSWVSQGVGQAEQPRAFRCERDRAEAAFEQRHAQVRFQGAYLPADRRLCQVQVGRRGGDAHAPAYRHETAHEIQGRQFG